MRQLPTSWPVLSAAVRLRVLGFALAAVVALVLGFAAVPPGMARTLIVSGGYYYMAALFSLAVYFVWRVAAPRRPVWAAWIRRPGWVGLALAGAAGLALWADPFQPKVLFDEYVLQATAFHLHATKEVGATVRAYDLLGTWLPIDAYLDKRPYFFAFLLSVVHDLTGYRVANVFFLNGALTGACFALVYWLGAQLTNRAGGLLAVALLATLPLTGQNASGAGMEMHNLAMLLGTMAAALLYVRAPDADRLTLLCLMAVLLAQSRYESVLYVGPVALLAVAGWWRAGRVLMPWLVVAVPLALVPYVWHYRVVNATPLIWQLEEGQTVRFGVEYLGRNLAAAGRFYFNFGHGLANSWWLSSLGVLALGWSGLRVGRWVRARGPVSPAAGVVACFGLGVAANLGVIMLYYWSRLDEPIASRFALPSYALAALLTAGWVQALNRRWPAWRWAFFGTAVFMLVSVLPTVSRRLYTSENLVMQEVAWERDFVARHRRGTVLVVTNKSTMPWVIEGTPAIRNDVLTMRTEQLRWHFERGTFADVFVAQALQPTAADGRFGLDPQDVLPARIHLERLAEKRFGGRMLRLSRIVRIDPAPAGS